MKKTIKKALSLVLAIFFMFGGINVFAASSSKEEVLAVLNNALEKTETLEAIKVKCQSTFKMDNKDVSDSIGNLFHQDNLTLFEYGKSLEDETFTEFVSMDLNLSDPLSAQMTNENNKTTINLTFHEIYDMSVIGEDSIPFDIEEKITINDQGTIDSVAYKINFVFKSSYPSNQESDCQLIYSYTVSPVNVRVNGVTVEQKELTLWYGQSAELTAIVTPSNADFKEVYWESENMNVASVRGYGEVYARKRGTTVAKVTTIDGAKTAEVTITVKYTWWQWIIKVLLFGWLWY